MNERKRKITGKILAQSLLQNCFSDDKQHFKEDNFSTLKVKVEISHSIFVIMIMIISMMSRKAQN